MNDNCERQSDAKLFFSGDKNRNILQKRNFLTNYFCRYSQQSWRKGLSRSLLYKSFFPSFFFLTKLFRAAMRVENWKYGLLKFPIPDGISITSGLDGLLTKNEWRLKSNFSNVLLPMTTLLIWQTDRPVACLAAAIGTGAVTHRSILTLRQETVSSAG